MKDHRRSYLFASDLANKVLKTPGPGSAMPSTPTTYILPALTRRRWSESPLHILDTDNPITYYLYGLALYKSGHNRTAADRFKKSIKPGPNSEYAKTARRLLYVRGP